jgi:hypothetical protein
MKEGDQTFAFGQQAASVHDARDDAALHRLDQGPVILPHPVVELDQLPSTRFVDVVREEVVENPMVRRGDSGQTGPIDRFAGPG